jgi:diaminopimelate epimerase
MRVFERGVGETQACGTGACAAAVAARLLRGAASRVTVCLPGGRLRIAWSGATDRAEPVMMTGPADYVFDGAIAV